ncbi:MAG: homoserine kinase [Opitutaceae bacterium]|nr:homoserine kinase [Opitutaceae bacterium]
MKARQRSARGRRWRVGAQSVTVRVPASTSNCGSGFDTIGLALKLYNEVTLTRGAGPVIGAATTGDAAAQAMVAAAAAEFFKRTARKRFGFTYHIAGDVPMSRGLGASVTVRAGVVAGLNELTGAKLTRHAMVALVTGLEGHPDNATPAVLGGFCVTRTDPLTGAFIGTVRLRMPEELVFVVAAPTMEIRTRDSRRVLPKLLPFFDAVKSVNSAAYLVAALATRDYDRLRHAVADFLHEPYRRCRAFPAPGPRSPRASLPGP